ncbi:MAG: hypothetical protein PVH18_06600 [Chloroflexota bacterium]|jgi:hypothetical protein
MSSHQPFEKQQDDRLLPLTRVVALIIIPFLLAAAAILYFSAETMGQRFAWDIQPPPTAFLVGSGYLGGAYFFARVVLGRRWHRVGAGFLPVAAYTAAMLLATLVHWDRFDTSHFPFLVWLILYVVTPLALPLIWAYNRRTDPGTAEADDVLVAPALRWVMAAAGGLVVAGAVIFFLWPDLAISIWPWTLSLLTARVLAGWHLLLGVGALVLATDRRWSAWRIPLQSIALWQVLLLLNMLRQETDLGSAGLFNWYMGYVLVGLLAIGLLYVVMERRRAQAASMPEE